MSSSIKSSFTFKVAVVSLLCVADIAVNAIADHKTSWPDSITPYALMGVQLMFQLCVDGETRHVWFAQCGSHRCVLC